MSETPEEKRAKARDAFESALRKTTIGGSAIPFGRDRPIELCRVTVPPEKAQPWTIVLGEPPRVGACLESADIYRTYAQLEWGNGGVYAHADVDWGQGLQMTVVGAEVTVRVVAPGIAGVEAWLALERLYAFIAPGSAGRNPLLTRTVYYGDIDYDQAVRQPIPAFAKRVWVTCQVPAGTGLFQMNLTFQRDAGTNVADLSHRAVATREVLNHISQTPVPVPPEATELRLYNFSVGDADVNNVTAIYELAL